MESQPEIVVAAEAVRTWVHTQRAGWKTGRAVAIAPLTASPAAVLDPPQQTGTLAPPPPAAWSQPPLATPATASAPPATIAPAIAESLFERVADPIEVEVSTPLLTRTWVRAALALAAVAVLAVGALLIRARVGSLRSVPATGTAVLESDPPGAAIVIDGTGVGVTPLSLALPVGQHTIEFKLKSATRKQTIAIAKGAQTAMTIDWNIKPLGSLRVEARPGPARVLVDGKERGTAPVTLTDLAVGAHTVQIETAEGSVRRRVEIAEGRTESISEEIFPGWLHIASPIEVTVVDGRQAVQLDASNRVLLKPGPHTIRVENRALEILGNPPGVDRAWRHGHRVVHAARVDAHSHRIGRRRRLRRRYARRRDAACRLQGVARHARHHGRGQVRRHPSRQRDGDRQAGAGRRVVLPSVDDPDVISSYAAGVQRLRKNPLQRPPLT
ncbi:MAG: PEGA domain-containing protein [Vicinamibacterales bacterium]